MNRFLSLIPWAIVRWFVCEENPRRNLLQIDQNRRLVAFFNFYHKSLLLNVFWIGCHSYKNLARA